MGLFNWFNKSNAAQRPLKDREPESTQTNKKPYTAASAYQLDPVVNRCVNLLVDSCAEIPIDIMGALKFTPTALAESGRKLPPATIQELLNIRPNPYQDANSFKRLLWMDFWIFGVFYIYWDGASLYHIPANGMTVYSAETGGYIERFVYDNKVEYKPSEILMVRDNALFGGVGTSQISGQSRVMSAINSITRKDKAVTFREKFIDKGCVTGLILETEQILNRGFKARILDEITINYNAASGKYTAQPVILDGGLKAKNINTSENMKNMSFNEDIQGYNKDICTAFGIPPILLDGGNNANISPNVKLFYAQTIIPSLRKFESALQLFFGYDIKWLTDEVLALVSSKIEDGQYITGLVNNGIITPNEGRKELRWEESKEEGMNTVRIPANISGSATGVSGQEGGAPKKTTNS